MSIREYLLPSVLQCYVCHVASFKLLCDTIVPVLVHERLGYAGQEPSTLYTTVSSVSMWGSLVSITAPR